VVEKLRAGHPQAVKNESHFKQHCHAASGVVVEAIFEIRTGAAGAFAPALFDTKCHDLAAKGTQKKRPIKKDLLSENQALRELCEAKNAEIASLNHQHSEFKAMHEEVCETKDAEIASISQQYSKLDAIHQETCTKHIADLAQLKASQLHNGEYGNEKHLASSLTYYKKKAGDAELANLKLNQEIGGVEELRNKLHRSSLGEKEARTELGKVRQSLKDEQDRFGRMRDRLTQKTKDLENEVKVANLKTASALKNISRMPTHALDFVNARIDCDLRIVDAKKFAKQEQLTAQGEKRIAEQANLRAALWKEEHSHALTAQWATLQCMPPAIFALFKPYITIPTETSSAESRIERRIACSML
jgi:hypothetical protein